MTLTQTSLYAGLLGLMLVLLSALVIRARVRARVSLGDGGDDALTRAIRAHANFIEYTPMALILIALAETQGAPALAIHAMGLLLVVGRAMHAVGLMTPNTINPWRSVGTVATFLVLVLTGSGLVVHALI